MTTSRAPRAGQITLAVFLGLWGIVLGQELPWRPESVGRSAELRIPRGRPPGFTFLSPSQTGLTFTNELDEFAAAANRVLLNGSGLAAGDYDQDGRVDLFFCSLSGQSRLFRNLGSWHFEDVTERTRAGLPGRITRGAVFADINGDGKLDLLVSTLSNGVICLVNDGHGQFTDTTQSAGTSSPYGSVTLALADVDGNGTLDLYVTNYRGEDIRDKGQVDLYLVKGQMVVPPKLKNRLLVVAGQILEFGEPDQLLLNDGQGHFRAASWTDGTFVNEDGQKLAGPLLDWGLTAMFRDINGDSFPDLYVCNDYWTPDRIWINDGQGHFHALDRLAVRQISSSSMGVDFADIDRDGHLDFIVTDMLSRDPRLRKRQMPARWPMPIPVESIEFRPQIIQNTVGHNRGDGTYEEIANFCGIAASEWTWQPVFLDVDLDGYPDLLVTAGHARDVQDSDASQAIQARQHSWKGFTNVVEKQKAFTSELMMHMRLYPKLEMPIFAFRNTRDLKFEEATASWRTGQLGVHHSMALADLDNDGDLDLVVNNLRAPAGLYRNDTDAGRVAVRLKGLPPNTQGIGAKVALLHGAIPRQEEEVICGGRYMAGSEPAVTFASGTSLSNMTLVVQWRSGETTRLEQVLANRLYEIAEPARTGASPAKAAPPKAASPASLFADVSDRLNHVHQETAFNDFARQALLPKKMSNLGPGVAWFDLNHDGWDDLLIGAGRGGQLKAFLNDQHGGFKPIEGAPFNSPVTRDQTGLLGLDLPNGEPTVLAGSSNYEDGLATGPAARRYDFAHQRIDETMAGLPSSAGPLAFADVRGTGPLSLFIGGRCVPGRYPEAASSLLMQWKEGRWGSDPENTRILRNVGLVSGAVWSDLDGDGIAELLLACEWGPIRVFKDTEGRLTEVTMAWGLDKLTGWWNSVTTGDFDEDGRLDILAGNWGFNSEYQASAGQPLKTIYGDWSGRGIMDVIETAYDPALKDFAPSRSLDALAANLPFLLDRFPTHKAFSEASIETVLGSNYSKSKVVEARTLASMLFLNRGNHFEPMELPREAQVAPAFAVAVADFDGDGHEDAFLSQNFFGRDSQTQRMDAGRGLLLLGDGKGHFRPVPGPESGIRIYGEQRAAAVSDFDRDGRVDLVVTQNAAPTRLLHNRTARPGLRVRLRGGEENRSGVGATVRLVFGDQFGPAREIHGGSGYWSEDSSVLVMGTPTPASQVWVRWPGGKVTTTSIPSNSQEITIDRSGVVAPR